MRSPTGSCRKAKDFGDFRGRFTVFKAVGHDAEDKRLDLGDRFFPGSTIGHGAGNDGHLGDPTAVLFAFDLNLH